MSLTLKQILNVSNVSILYSGGDAYYQDFQYFINPRKFQKIIFYFKDGTLKEFNSLNEMSPLELKKAVQLRTSQQPNDFGFGISQTYSYYFYNDTTKSFTSPNAEYESYINGSYFVREAMREEIKNSLPQPINLVVPERAQYLVEQLTNPEWGSAFIRENYSNVYNMVMRGEGILNAPAQYMTQGLESYSVQNIWIDEIHNHFGTNKNDILSLRQLLWERYAFQFISDNEEIQYLAENRRRANANSSPDMITRFFQDIGNALSQLNSSYAIAKWSFENPKEAAIGIALVTTGVGVIETLTAAVQAGTITQTLGTAIAAKVGIDFPPKLDDVTKLIEEKALEEIKNTQENLPEILLDYVKDQNPQSPTSLNQVTSGAGQAVTQNNDVSKFAVIGAMLLIPVILIYMLIRKLF